MKFTPEHFYQADQPSHLQALNDWQVAFVVAKAQAAFDAWLGEQLSVVCRKDDGKWACDEHPGFARATHRARLVAIEEIGK